VSSVGLAKKGTAMAALPSRGHLQHAHAKKRQGYESDDKRRNTDLQLQPHLLVSGSAKGIGVFVVNKGTFRTLRSTVMQITATLVQTACYRHDVSTRQKTKRTKANKAPVRKSIDDRILVTSNLVEDKPYVNQIWSLSIVCT